MGASRPGACTAGYEQFSFGNKDAPSPFATARVVTVLARLSDLAEEIAAVDVKALPSSKGGSGVAVPPEQQSAAAAVPEACPMPSVPTYDPARVLPRVLSRHHLNSAWEQQTPDSVTYDVVGLVATDPATPYLTLSARIPGFDATAFEQALDRRHSMVRWRGMRGVLQVFRRDFVPAVFAANSPQVIKYARDYAKTRGVDAKAYEQWAARVIEECREDALSLGQLRDRLKPPVDLGAVISLMTAEGVLVRSHPERGRTDRRMTFAPREVLLPGVELDRLTQDEGRAQVLRAYVRGYGPVSQRDAAWWTGMDLKRVRRAMDALEDEIVEVALKGHEGTWLMHAADAEELEWASLLDQPNVAVLPANDPLIVGYTDRSRFIDDVARPYVFDAAHNAAPTVLVNGRIVAVWDVAAARSPDADDVLVFAVAPSMLRPPMPSTLRSPERAWRCREEPARVRHLSSMRSLATRPIGAFAHPLR